MITFVTWWCVTQSQMFKYIQKLIIRFCVEMLQVEKILNVIYFRYWRENSIHTCKQSATGSEKERAANLTKVLLLMYSMQKKKN